MIGDALELIVRFNLALAAAILLVLVLRTPVRRWFGARVAYALWLIPPLAAAMCFAPARIRIVTIPAQPPTASDVATTLSAIAPPPAPPLNTIDFPILFLSLWAGGVLFSLAILALRQRRFVKALGRLNARGDLGAGVFAAESSASGPAVIGVLKPVIVAPADFDTRYSPEERRIVLAHERAHLAQGDPLINAVAALLQCVNWFNPFIHLGVRALRVDQEFACDAVVLARAPTARRPYAEALLKAQTGAAPVPLGCAWPSPSLDAFKERILMLKRTVPSRAQTLIGASALALATAGACALAWAAQPDRVVLVKEEQPPLMQRIFAAADSRIIIGDSDDIATHFYNEEDLAGGSDYDDEDYDIDAAEIREEVREAMEEAHAAMAEARAEMDQARVEMARAGMSEEEIRRITEEAMAEAHAAIAEAQLELNNTELERQNHVHESALEAEMEQHAHALADQALRLASASLDDSNELAGERAAIEAEMESRLRRIEELAAQIEAQASEDMRRDRVRNRNRNDE